MDFMKMFDQTVREIKREVNLKILNIPEIEQKVLDATDNEPWGPHGSALAEIVQATKNYSECQIIMNVLWTRLSETGKDWRYVFKALTVLEYLVANGSERAVDDIIEHTYRIASLSSFEYLEPNGKDVGINVRKKVENIVALLNDKDKIQEARSKATKTRDKYVGLSSSGITYKSSTGSGSASYRNSNYGGFSGKREHGSFSDRHKDKEQSREDKYERDMYKSRQGVTGDNQVKASKRGSTRYGRVQTKVSSNDLKSSTKETKSDKQGANLTHSSSLPSNSYDDEFDDFDPRGTSTADTAGSSNNVDLFANFMDEPHPIAKEAIEIDNNTTAPELDLFADAFGSVSPTKSVRSSQNEVDLFASQPALSPARTSQLDLFSAPHPVAKLKSTESPTTAISTMADPFAPLLVQKVDFMESASPANLTTVDPFASVSLNSFDGSNLFGAFGSQNETNSKDTLDDHTPDSSTNCLSGNNPVEWKPLEKRNSFQVKSGIWADSLSRGLIDLNITAPRKVNLADIGVVGDLGDGTNDRDKGVPPSYMGSAMGSGLGLGSSSSDDFFSSMHSKSQSNQYGGFMK